MRFLTKVKTGDTYAVHTGDYAGELLIYIKKKDSKYGFLSIPTMVNRDIPVDVFESARNSGIIKFVEVVPSFVIKTSIAQYNKNENSSNRRQQSDP